MSLKEVKFAFDNVSVRVSELVTGNLKIIIDDKSSVVIGKDNINRLDEIVGKKMVPIIKHLFSGVG